MSTRTGTGQGKRLITECGGRRPRHRLHPVALFASAMWPRPLPGLLAPCLSLAAGCGPGASSVHTKSPTGTSRTPAASAASTASAHAPVPVTITVQATVAPVPAARPVFRTMTAAGRAVFVLGGLNAAGVTISDVIARATSTPTASPGPLGTAIWWRADEHARRGGTVVALPIAHTMLSGGPAHLLLSVSGAQAELR